METGDVQLTSSEGHGERSARGLWTVARGHEAVSALLQCGAEVRCPGLSPLVAWPCTTPARLSISESAVDSVSLTQLWAGDGRDRVCRGSEFKLHSARLDATRNGSALPGPGVGRLEWPTWGSFANFFKKG